MIDQTLQRLLKATDVAIGLLRPQARMEEVGPGVLEQFARAAGCEWGAYWTVEPPSRDLRAVATWSVLDEEGQLFEQDTRQRTLAPRVGNAWHVWRSRRPLWATNLVFEMCMPRCLKASAAGLRTGVWFGVQTDTAVYGVIELLARELPNKRYEVFTAFERAGFRLGYALEELSEAGSRLH